MKLYRYAIGLMGLGMLTACSSDMDETAIDEETTGQGNVTLKVQLPGDVASRAVSDLEIFGSGKMASELTCAVYRHREDLTEAPHLVFTTNATFDQNLQATVELALANGKEYDIVFWASNSSLDAKSAYRFDTDNARLEVTYAESMTNSEAFDAFWTCYKTGEVQGPITDTIVLRRPLAQINVGTGDLDASAVRATFGDNLAKLVTTVETKAFTGMDMVSGVADGWSPVTFVATVPEGQTFPVADCSYLSMQYVLMGRTATGDFNRRVVDTTISFYDREHPATPYAQLIPSLPLQCNYRTNIYGDIITSPGEFSIDVNPTFDGNDDIVL